MELFGVAEVTTHTRSNIAPGWAYVPVPDSLPNAQQPTGRKRAARNITGAGGDTSAKQDAKVLKSLAELDKDSGGGRDVQIPVPVKARDGAGRASHGKVTPNVRRILQSQKTFANHLSDAEALAALSTSNSSGTSSAPHSNLHTDKPKHPNQYTARASPSSTPGPDKPKHPNQHSKRDGAPASTPAAKATSNSMNTSKRSHKKKAESELDTPGPKATSSRRTSTLNQVSTPTPTSPAIKPEDSTADVIMENTSEAESAPLLKPLPTNLELKPHHEDNNALLKSRIPPVPDDDELQRLIATPALTYLEARGSFPKDEVPGKGKGKRPMRRFCEICGYWGRVTCLGCGAKVCALECLRVHKEECYTRYGA